MKPFKMRFENLEFEQPRTDESGTNEEVQEFEATDNSGIAEAVGPEPTLDFGSEEVAVKLEHYSRQLASAIDLRNTIGNGKLTPSSVAMAHYHLDQMKVHVPSMVRMEGSSDETKALSLRCESIIDTVWGKIVKFWEWIVEKVKSLFKSSNSAVKKEDVKEVKAATAEIVKAVETKLDGTESEQKGSSSKKSEGKKFSMGGLERAMSGDNLNEVLAGYKNMGNTGVALKQACESMLSALESLKGEIGKSGEEGDIGITNTIGRTVELLKKSNQNGVLDKVANGKNDMTIGLEAGFGKVLAFGASDSGTGFIARTLSYEGADTPSFSAQEGTSVVEAVMGTLDSFVDFGSYFGSSFVSKAEDFTGALKKANPKNKALPMVLAKGNSAVSGLVRAAEVYSKNGLKLVDILNGLAKKG